MSLLKTMFKDQARGLMVGLVSVVYVFAIFCGCLLLPMWVSRVTDGGIWGLIVGAVLFSVMLFVAPALCAGFVIHRRNRSLDSALTPLGLQGRALDVVWREYHGEIEGRAVTARFYRGPSFELGVSVPAQTRAAISRAAVVIPQLARAFNYQPFSFAGLELADLSISGLDEAWMRAFLSTPDVRAAAARLVLAADDWAALQQIVIGPTMVKLWLYRNKNLWRYEIEPAAARQWLADLLLLARAIEEIPPPREPMQESALEKVARSNWNKWMWVFVVFLAVGLPLCGVLIAALMLTLDKL
jgi:hypothetical protein